MVVFSGSVSVYIFRNIGVTVVFSPCIFIQISCRSAVSLTSSSAEEAVRNGIDFSPQSVIEVGREVEVVAGELGVRTMGKVAHVGSLLGEQSRAATARVTLANPDGAWRPGLFVTVRVSADGRSAPVTVPVEAVQTDENAPTVFVRTPHGFQAHPVSLGQRDENRVEIRDGLQAGQQIATAGSFILKSELGKGSAEHVH